MIGPDRKIRRALDAHRPGRGAYEVGYGKPPAHSRFKPGQSGNPRGRPKGAKNKIPALNEERLKSIILAEAYRTVNVKENNRNVTVPIAQAIVRSLAVNAARGNTRAQQLFARLLIATETSYKQLHDEWVDTALTYKFDWQQELERRKQLGIEAPDPVPHPDHIELDMKTGQIIVKGPMTPEEKAKIDWLIGRREAFEEELVELKQELIDNPDHPYRRQIEADIEHDEKLLAMLRKVT